MQLQKIIHKIVIISSLILMTSVLPSISYAHSLLQLTTLAEQNDHTYLQSRAQNRAEKLQYEIDRGKTMPTLSAVGSFDYTTHFKADASKTTAGMLNLSHTFALANYKQLTVDQYKRLAAQLSDISAYQDLLSRLAASYFIAAKDQLILANNQQQLATSRKILAIVKQQYLSGNKTRTDMLNAQVTMNTNKVAIISQQNILSNDLSKLQVIAGVNPMHVMTLKTNYPFHTLIPLPTHHVLQLIINHNPMVLASRFSAVQSFAAIKQLRSTRWPSLQSSIDYSRSSTDQPKINNSGVISGSGIDASLALNIPLVQPGLTDSIRQAEDLYQAAREKYRLNQAKTIDALRQAHHNLLNDFKQINQLTGSIIADKKALKNTLYAYQGGLQNLTSVQQAEQAVYAQQQNYIRAQYDYITSQISFQAATGSLNQKSIIRINSWLH